VWVLHVFFRPPCCLVPQPKKRSTALFQARATGATFMPFFTQRYCRFEMGQRFKGVPCACTLCCGMPAARQRARWRPCRPAFDSATRWQVALRFCLKDKWASFPPHPTIMKMHIFDSYTFLPATLQFYNICFFFFFLRRLSMKKACMEQRGGHEEVL